MGGMMQSSLLLGHLMHSRQRPFPHHFTYPVYSLLVNLDELPLLQERVRGFSYNGRNLPGIYDEDHLDDTPLSIKEKLLAYLSRQGVALPDGAVYMLANARVLGYVFDPITLFYCYNQQEELELVVVEVHNTKHERFPYLLNGQNQLPVTAKEAAKGVQRHTFDKQFYVSPFIEMAARYELAYSPLGSQMFVHIDEFTGEEKFFQARLWGELRPFTSQTLRHVLWYYPLMTLKVKGAIYWQAIKLLRRGLPLLPKPPVPPAY
jgi:DUF1365 family protein